MSTRSNLPPELTPGGGWPYRLERLAGQGSSSRVWLATRRGDGQPVALKIGRSDRERTRLASEAERLFLVSSPGLGVLLDAGRVPVTLAREHGELAGSPYIALEWVEGERLDLASRWSVERRLAAAHAVARDVGEALADLHAAGFAHGDIKPANVLLRAGDDAHTSRAHLIDLGLVEGLAAEAVLGATPAYLPPEALQPTAQSDARTRDLWAFGLTLAELVAPELRERKGIASVAPETLSAAPPALRALILALLSAVPAARPSAQWVASSVRASLRQPLTLLQRAERWRSAVRQSYLATRRNQLRPLARGAALAIDVAGVAGDWLREASVQLDAIARLRRPAESEALAAEPLGDLPEFEQRRWLVRLIGSSAAHFPRLPALADSELAQRLLSHAERRDPRTLTFADLGADDGKDDAERAEYNALEIAARLSRGEHAAALIEAAREELRRSPQATALSHLLAHALRRRGDWAQALLLFDEIGADSALAEAAETCRRLGDGAGAQARLARLAGKRLGSVVRGRMLATQARLAWDAGDLQSATQLLRDAPEVAAVLEVKALLALRHQALDEALAHASAALSAAQDNEEAARAHSVLGNAHHARGDPERALEAYRRAAEYAARAGAVVEEATYAANVAAAATDLGDLSEALEHGQRALLLFEHLDRTRDCGRVALTLLNAHAAVGALAQARHWFSEVMRRVRVHRDEQCQAYAHLTMADLLPSSPEAAEHAERAASLLTDSSSDDRLRAASRSWRVGRELPVLEMDALAHAATSAADARLDWWAARAFRALQGSTPFDAPQATLILTALTPLAALALAPRFAGPNFADAARLAMRAGEGDMARRFARVGSEALRRMERGTPAELRAALRQLPWVDALHEPAQGTLSREQIGHLETLVRSLGTRDRLQPLLDQVLDALVLWTGVERGLVLLKAPGGRLLPRAARNLARRDIVGEQLRLSQSLAERALHSAEPVVAIDAAGEMSDLHQSVHALGLRSVLAVPLIARGEALGVVYLDDRTRRGAFGSAELAWVRLVGTLAALAIADARDQLLLRRAVRRARNAEQRVLTLLARREAQVTLLQQEIARGNDRGTRFSYDTIVGSSSPMREMLKLVDRLSTSDISVLICGESGSGKELVARSIHQNSGRSGAAFVSENCAAIPEPLLESTLFGHVRGAFTGAARARTGLFEMAHEGTLFLDEVGEMSLAMQTKLLRAIETGEVRPVGSERSRTVDVRVLAATHRDLERMVAVGTFRQDLYYRLNVISVRVPPLRERYDDIDLLLLSFCQRHGAGRTLELTGAARNALRAYTWPGNVRELENEVRRLLVLSDGRVDLAQLSPAIAAAAGSAAPVHDLDLRGHVDALESSLLSRALARTQGNQTRAAELLGVSRFGLQKMMKRLNIEPLRSGREPGVELTEGQ